MDISAGTLKLMNDYAYIAGFLDGEGCISIASHFYHNKKNYNQMAIQISNTNKDVLEYIQNVIGGSFTVLQHKGNRKPVHQLCFFGWTAYGMLKQIYPYLILKSEQARVAMEFQETFNCVRIGIHRNEVPDEVMEKRRLLAERMKVLNHKGIFEIRKEEITLTKTLEREEQ